MVKVKKRSSATVVCITFLLCAATAITSPAQTFTTLVNFSGPNGAEPFFGSLVQGADGNFYGTTRGGGTNSRGTVFKMTPSGALTSLYSFCSKSNCADGADPDAGLVQGSDGNFYGTTTAGGANTDGTVFKITPSGSFTLLHSFMGSDGFGPTGTLLQASDGNFYGTTPDEGPHGFGTVFKITPDGTLTTLYGFDGENNGGTPFAGLVQGSDGNFYGTASAGGSNVIYGTVFRITPTGGLTTLHSFDGSDGTGPYGTLLQATDGNFYGSTSSGGTSQNCTFGCGTIFKITPGGSFTSLHSFDFTDGGYVLAGLIQASDGNFYGTAGTGGSTQNCGDGCGTIFQLTPSGTLTTLHSFAGFSTDGSLPVAGLLQASNGTFYGTAEAGGSTGDGTVFSLDVGLVLSPVQFVPVTPCRLVDTRGANGEFGGPPLQAKSTRFFIVPDNQNCNIPATAAAYSLNVTVSPHGPLGYLTAWPTGRPQPLVSTLNSVDGRVKANAAIVPAGASDAVSFYVTDTTDLILDIDGYFTATSGSTLAFYPLPPCRIADTRGPDGDLGGPYLMAKTNRDFPVLEATSCNIPSSAQVYSLNFTAIPHGSLGYLTVCQTPSDPSQNCPLVSTLNSYGGQVTANAAIVPAGLGGDIRTYPSNDTDLIIDINGYFAAPGTGGLSLYPVAPCRVLDTRPNAFQFELNPPVDVRGSVCNVPSQSQAYVFNATVVPQGPLDYLALWPDGQDQPVVSTLNAYDGVISSNMAIVPAGATNGKVDAWANPVNKIDPTDLTNLILDISSYFAP